MKRLSIFVLRTALVLLGAFIFVAMLWEPHLEGVNAHAGFWAVYADPFVAYAYLGSVPFFVGVYQASQFLGYAGRDEASSSAAAKALRNVRYCALGVVVFILGAEVWIMLTHGDDDAAGVFALGIVATVLGLGTAAAATTLERSLRRGGLTPAGR